jgi:hypothetical protein
MFSNIYGAWQGSKSKLHSSHPGQTCPAPHDYRRRFPQIQHQGSTWLQDVNIESDWNTIVCHTNTLPFFESTIAAEVKAM